MKRSFAVVGLLGLSLGLCDFAQAGPLDPKLVAADAKWTLHMDADAAKSATLVQKMREKWLSREKTKKKLAEMKEQTGFDPSEDLRGVTFYGTTFKPHHGVMLIQAKFDREKVIELIKKKHDPEVKEHGDHKLYTWEHRRGRHERELTFVAAKDDLAVIGAHVDEVRAALDVIDGKAAGLGSDSPLAAGAPKGTIVLASAVGLGDAKLPIKSHVLKDAKNLRITAGETDGQVFLSKSLTAASTEVASQVKALADGVRAMGQLKFHSKPELLKLANGLSSKVDGSTVTVELRLPTGDVEGAAEKMREMIRSHHDKRKGQGKHGWHHRDRHHGDDHGRGGDRHHRHRHRDHDDRDHDRDYDDDDDDDDRPRRRHRDRDDDRDDERDE